MVKGNHSKPTKIASKWWSRPSKQEAVRFNACYSEKFSSLKTREQGILFAFFSLVIKTRESSCFEPKVINFRTKETKTLFFLSWEINSWFPQPASIKKDWLRANTKPRSFAYLCFKHLVRLLTKNDKWRSRATTASTRPTGWNW